MKWEKQEMEEIEDVLTSLSSLKSIANEKLKEAQNSIIIRIFKILWHKKQL